MTSATPGNRPVPRPLRPPPHRARPVRRLPDKNKVSSLKSEVSSRKLKSQSFKPEANARARAQLSLRSKCRLPTSEFHFRLQTFTSAFRLQTSDFKLLLQPL